VSEPDNLPRIFQANVDRLFQRVILLGLNALPTIITVDVLLPRRSSDGFRLANASIQNANISVHGENYQGGLLRDVVESPIRNGIGDAGGVQTGLLTAQIGPLVQSLSGLLTKNKFD
jgi:hypothetical protein